MSAVPESSNKNKGSDSNTRSTVRCYSITINPVCNLDYRLGFIYFIISRYYNKLKIKIGDTKLCRQQLTVLGEIISF